MIQLEIHGNPIAKKRPRFANRGKYVAVINDQETEEGRFLLDARQQMNGQSPMQGAVAVSMQFHMPIPKSVSKKVRGLMIENKVMHTKKPDLDNLIKFAKDCLNGLAWGDDSQVVEVYGRKVYGVEPMTMVTIQEVGLP